METKESSPLIGTHGGAFHADEALAVSLLRSLDRFKSSRLVRTRDPAILETCDVVVDVGGEYDPSRHRYDHHQLGFGETYSENHRIKLSSAGLIYKHFGQEIVANHLGLPVDHATIPILVAKMYDAFIEAIDGIDNGIECYEAMFVLPNGTQAARKHYSSQTDLSSRIGYLNPPWNQPGGKETQDACFEKASNLAGSEFFTRLDYFSQVWLPGRELVLKAFNNRFDNDAKDKLGRILILDRSCPWKDHLSNLEKAEKSNPLQLPVYVIFPDEDQSWRIQGIPLKPGRLELRKALPVAWRGLRNAALSESVGIPGCMFVHTSGFIGGHEAFQGALQMAQIALGVPPAKAKKRKGKKGKNSK